ncbi:Mechanosensitive ion channel protein 10-like protein [Drosera capensis]
MASNTNISQQGGEINFEKQMAHRRRHEQLAIQIPVKTASQTFPFNEEVDTTRSKFSPAPDITMFYPQPSPNKPPRVPNRNLSRRSTTLKTKPKSRFGEPSLPIDPAALWELAPNSPAPSFREATPSSNNHRASVGRGSSFVKGVTPRVAASSRRGETTIEGPDEREVYERVTAQLSARDKKRMTVKLLIELAVFLFVSGCLISSLTIHGLKVRIICGLPIWRLFLFLLVILSGMLVTHWMLHVVVFLIEWKFLLKKNVVYFTHGLKTSVEVFIWITLILATWALLIEPDVRHTNRIRNALDFITWTLLSLLLCSFLWLIKTIMIKTLAASFHLNRFFDRIQESIFHHYVLQTLSGRPVVELASGVLTRTETHNGMVSFTEHTKTHTEKKMVDMGKLHQMKQEKVPDWTMQLLVDVVSNSGLSTMSGILDEDMAEGGVELDDDEITSEEQAIATAVRIFCNIVKDKDDQTYIDRKDLHRFLICEEVDLVFPLFEVKDKDQISLKAFSKWVVKLFKERQALKHALNDNKTAVKQLDKLVTSILIVVIIAVWLLLTELMTTKVLLFFTSQLLVAVFVFGNTCKTIFEAIIFVFVMHPFDVGDRCVIDGTTMLVEEMNILTTVFLKWDKEKVYYPNAVLSTKAIGNYYRSPDQVDSLEFSIDFRTPLSKIGEIKERIKKYLHQNPHLWHPNHNLVVKEIENVNKIKTQLIFNHTMNFQEFPERMKRRTELVLELKKIFEELDIKYNLLPQEVILNNVGP